MSQIDRKPPANPDPTGRAYWRSLDELADTPEFREMVAREFPAQASELKDVHSRRAFLQVMGASLSLAGLTGCRWPRETILPFANRPVGRIPGVPVQYATAMEIGGAAQGLLVTSYDGRPVKIEGNPSHPINGSLGMPNGGSNGKPAPRGAADVFAQAGLLDLYDPDRSKNLVHRDGRQAFEADWDEFAAFATSHFAEIRAKQGRGLYVLTEASSSPSLAHMRERFLAAFPQARWHEYEPLSRDNERTGARLAFGRPMRTHLDLAGARVILSLDSDFLIDHPAALRHARDFAQGRKADQGEMNRLYVVESTYTVTGGMADHRLALPASSIGVLSGRLAAEVLSALGGSLPAGLPAGLSSLRGAFERFRGEPGGVAVGSAFLAPLVRDLVEHRGHGLLTAGPRQPAEVHAIAHLLNAALGNTGRTLRYTEEIDPDRPAHLDSIRDLASAISGGQVDTLVLLGGNPVYTAPPDLEFARLLEAVPTSIHLGLHPDETAKACTWHLPRAHYLESWGDVRSWDGTVSIVQPLIAPLYDGKTPIELLALIGGDDLPKGYDIVRRRLREQHAGRGSNGQASGPGDFESIWRTALEDGVLPGTAFESVTPALNAGSLAPALASLASLSSAQSAPGPQNLEIVFCPDGKVLDGRFANNGWLQETPGTLTKLTWDNAALLSPGTAAALGVAADDLVTLHYRGRSLRMPVYVLPGQAPFSVAVALGYGRTAAGRVGNGVGFDAYRLRTSEAPGFDTGLTLERAGGTYKLACTQDHHAIDTVGREEIQHRAGILVREGTLSEYRHKPDFAQEKAEHPPLVSLWQEQESKGHKWGMAIDLNSCIGCNACVVACTAENNVPVVGKERVLEGREMQWIRIDRYFTGDPETPEVVHEPVACVHCENAPCEQVCPVGATMHDSDGLNVMVYNRCIGTRYCSNNCPFKVRRFNFFNYRKDLTPTEKMAFNPDVTVRSRGVMEKCSYCIQRIEAVKIAAKNDRRPIRDGEIVPACAQTCPTEAIVFGDLNDPDSRVARQQKDPRSYAMLADLNIKPRTHHLARLRNPAGEGA